MNKLAFFTLSALIFSAVSAHAAWWKPVLTCDNGAARVEVDLGERTHVQIVITDKGIHDYFYHSGITDFSPYNGNGDYVGGSVRDGIFNSSQFTGFTRGGVSPTCRVKLSC